MIFPNQFSFFHLESNGGQTLLDFVLQLMGLPEKFGEFLGETVHLFLEGFAIVGLFLDADIPSRREDVVLLGNLLGGCDGAEALYILQCSVLVGIEGLGNLGNVFIGHFAQTAGDHCPHFSGINEAGLVLLLLVPGEEPERNGDLGRVEKLCRHGDDAGDQVVLDDSASDVAFAARLAGEGAIGQHHADFAVGGEVVDHVLEPCEVGVSRRRHTVFPPLVFRQSVGSPVGEIEGRIGHDEIRLQSRVAVVEEGVGVELSQVGLDAPDGEVHLRHLPSCRIGILPIDGDVVDVALVVLDELRGLYEHPARAATRVIDARPL